MHAAYGRNFILKGSIDNQYLITESIHQDMENEFESDMDARPPNTSINNFDSLEAGIGIKFNKISYEILISSNDENFYVNNKPHYGGRIRYLFL